MTHEDRQLWKSIRDNMATAELEPGGHCVFLVRLSMVQFDLLYGEVNAKCHADTVEALNEQPWTATEILARES